MSSLIACVHVHHMPGALGGCKRVLGLLELELQMVMTTMCVLGIEPRFFVRAVCVLIHGAISPAPVSPTVAEGSHYLQNSWSASIAW